MGREAKQGAIGLVVDRDTSRSVSRWKAERRHVESAGEIMKNVKKFAGKLGKVVAKLPETGGGGFALPAWRTSSTICLRDSHRAAASGRAARPTRIGATAPKCQ